MWFVVACPLPTLPSVTDFRSMAVLIPVVALVEPFTRFSSLAPFRLSSATSPSFPLCTLRIRSIYCQYSPSADITFKLHSAFICSYCRSLRYLTSNHFEGTIPPQLGNLAQLNVLYSRSPDMFISEDSSAIDSLSIAVLICSLSFSQVPVLESAQWHHPISARQPH